MKIKMIQLAIGIYLVKATGHTLVI